MGQGTSVSAPIAQITKIVERSKLPHKLTPMSTIVQGDWDNVMALIKRCHRKAMASGERVITHISIDDRKGCRNPIVRKIASVEQKLGRAVDK